MQSIKKQIKKSIKSIRKKSTLVPQLGLILGSGLGIIADSFENKTIIPYEKIPYFPISTVKGNSNTLILGEYFNIPVVIMNGRTHYYEGFSVEEITYPVRVFKELGIDKLIVTNTAGGINSKFKIGDLMIITDHINFMAANPLRGWRNEEVASRFIDMNFAYNPKLQQIAIKAAKSAKIKIQKGIYAAMIGPSYETPAEIKMLKKIGADAVGMSTVPEVIVANQLGIKVLGISLITNLAAGILKKKIDHKEVIKVSEKTKDKFIKLIHNIIRQIANASI